MPQYQYNRLPALGNEQTGLTADGLGNGVLFSIHYPLVSLIRHPRPPF